jgi:hypothetical protein
MALDKEAVAEMKRLYHGNELTLVQIGARFGISATAVSRRARREGWLMRSELKGASPRVREPSTPRVLELVVHQFCEAINAKLKQMEAQMQAGKLSSEEFERDARSLGQMVGSALKVTTTVPDGDETQRAHSAGPAADATAACDDVERLHREIVERFERIQRRRNAEAGSG